MKKIILGLLLSISALASSIPPGPSSPIIWGPGCAYNLITHACIGSGGGSPVGPDGSIQYNNLGSFVGDSEFIRDLATHATEIQSQTFAFGSDNNNTTITADNAGDIGNVSIPFNGTDDNATVIAAWNLAHSTQTVSLTSGNPTDIITAQTILVGGGGPTGLSIGVTPALSGLGVDGSYLYNVDVTNGVTMIDGVGGAGALVGSPFSIISGVLGNVNAFHVINLQGGTDPFQQFGVSDNSSYQSAVGISPNGVNLHSSSGGNGNEVSVTPADVTWTSNNINYHLPAGSAPSTNEVISVQNVTGNDVQLQFASGSGGGLPNGTQYNQALFWDNAGSVPVWSNFYAITDDTSGNNTVMGYKAFGLNSSGSFNSGGSVDNTIIGGHNFEQVSGGQITSFGTRNGNHTSTTTYTNIFGSDNSGDGTTNIDSSNFFGTQNTWGPAGGGLDSVNIFGSLNHANKGTTTIFGNNIVSYVQNSILIGDNIPMSFSATGGQIIAMGTTMGFSNLTSGHDLLILGGWGGPGNFTSGAYDTCLLSSCNNVTSGSYNTAINNAGQTISVENLNTLLGYGADITIANSASTALGAYAKTTQSNQLKVGNNTFAAINHVSYETNGSNIDERLDDSTAYQQAGSQWDIFGGASTGTQYGGQWTFHTTAPLDATIMSSNQNTQSRWAVFGAQFSGFGDLDLAGAGIYTIANNQRGSGNLFTAGAKGTPVISGPSYSGTTGGLEDAILGGAFSGPPSVTYTLDFTFVHNQDVNYTLSSGVTPSVGDTFSTMDGRNGVVIGTGSLGYFIVSMLTTGGTGLDVPIPNGSSLAGTGTGGSWSALLTADGNLYADEYNVNDSFGHVFFGYNAAATQTFSYGAQITFGASRGHDVGLLVTWVYNTSYGNIYSYQQGNNIIGQGDIDAVVNPGSPSVDLNDMANSDRTIQANAIHLIGNANTDHNFTAKGLILNVSHMSSSGGIGSDDYTVLVDASAGSVTITVPDATTVGGRIVNIKKIDSSINSVVVASSLGGQLIDGSATIILATQNDGIQLQADSSGSGEWWILK